MRECKGFECQYKEDAGCKLFGPNTDCTIRTCHYSCKSCKNTCKNKKSVRNKSGNIKKSMVE